MSRANDATRHVVGDVARARTLGVGRVEVGDGALGTGFAEILEFLRLGASDFEHFLRESSELGAVNAERLIARARFDLVQHGELATLLVDERLDVKVGDAARTGERGELVKVRREQTRRLNLVDDVFADGPRETESVVRARAPTEFVDDDKTGRRRRLENGRRLEHLRHEG